MTKIEILDQINTITSCLIGLNLSEEQNFPSEKDGSIYITGNHDISISLKNIPYSEIYTILREDKNYNFKLIDGALIQIQYLYNPDGNLRKYRLAFFPSPSLEEFQNKKHKAPILFKVINYKNDTFYTALGLENLYTNFIDSMSYISEGRKFTFFDDKIIFISNFS
ncbi:hypothetical protein LCGC14_2057320 [marine sediment metagenome]|uniref:Uncharacterized protein n=1 Tax=marine sediment metagenome TaxID=412755 RepID=A0A0F9H0P3_9ZZZZ